MLSSLYDDSDGFYRRLHPILVKPKDPKRKKITRLYEMILDEEREQVFKWALEGLRRVMQNNWTISWSERSQNYMRMNKSNAVHFGDFFAETCTIDAESDTTTAEITNLYKRWCKDNGVKESSDRRLANWFSDNAEKLGIERSENIVRQGKRLRGYFGVKIKGEWKNVLIV